MLRKLSLSYLILLKFYELYGLLLIRLVGVFRVVWNMFSFLSRGRTVVLAVAKSSFRIAGTWILFSFSGFRRTVPRWHDGRHPHVLLRDGAGPGDNRDVHARADGRSRPGACRRPGKNPVRISRPEHATAALFQRVGLQAGLALKVCSYEVFFSHFN